MSTKKAVQSKTAKPTQTKVKKFKIVFVCTGNTCRSAMAETIMKKKLKEFGADKDFSVSSAGLYANNGDDMTPQAKEALRLLGYPKRVHKAKKLTPALIKSSGILVCMTEGHKSRIDSDKAFSIKEITQCHDVDDPYGNDVAVYLSVAKFLEFSADDVLSKSKEIKGVESSKKV